MASKSESVTLEEAKEQVRRVCVRLGQLHLSFARTLVKELGEEKGKELIIRAIKEYGRRIGEGAKKKAAFEGLDNGSANYKEDLPLYGMHDSVDKVEVDGEIRIRSYGCVMGKLWQELGESELGRLYCYVDPAKYMTFNPDFKLMHLKALPDGDEYCELVVRPTSEQERSDFADKDKDWTYLDRENVR